MTTNAEFAQKKGIDLSRFEVRVLGQKSGTFTHGLRDDSYKLEYDVVAIHDRETGKRIAGPIGRSPSTQLCLPDRSIAANKGTDEEFILAILGDEPIFPHYNEEPR